MRQLWFDIWKIRIGSTFVERFIFNKIFRLIQAILFIFGIE